MRLFCLNMKMSMAASVKVLNKFIKQKKKKLKKEKILERSQEIKKHFKVKENLKLLNKYVKQIRTHSQGIYYNRSKGLYEKRQRYNNKMYQEFMKARTPKNCDTRGFKFTQLFSKQSISKENLRNSSQEDFFKALTHKSNKSMSKSQKSEPIFVAKNTAKSKPKVIKIAKKIFQGLGNNINTGQDETMKKTLEENNKEREINLFSDNEMSSQQKNTTQNLLFLESNKLNDSQTHESIFSNSMKLTAFRANEVKKRNEKFIKLYGKGKPLKSQKLQMNFIKLLHNSALTIQNFWREFILTRKTQGNSPSNGNYMEYHNYESKSHSNNNRSSSRNAGVPKLNLAQVASKRESEISNQDGIFNHESMLDLSKQHLRDIMINSDVSSMIKVREEAINYKIMKEKKKIQKLLSSQKISPRTGTFKELELEKWITNERMDIDKTKKIYEENKQKTEEIIKETMGVDNVFANFEMTHETLKKLFNDKVTTPRDGLSFRSGFNSSRRLYELSQINKQIADEDNDEFDDLKNYDHDNIIFSDHEDSKDPISLRQKIELKLRSDHEITFGEKNRDD